jgi:hypothetical protein
MLTQNWCCSVHCSKTNSHKINFAKSSENLLDLQGNLTFKLAVDFSLELISYLNFCDKLLFTLRNFCEKVWKCATENLRKAVKNFL